MKTRSFLYRSFAIGSCFVLANLCTPQGAIALVGKPLGDAAREQIAKKAKREKKLAERRAKSASRALTDKEQQDMQGKSGENPYFAGAQKWDVFHKGVDLVSGNFGLTATDLTFEGGYGIPVNVTRSYSANDPDEGPFGKGWSLSADVRNTAGGVLKSGGAPVRTVPVEMVTRHSTEDDPNIATNPVEAVIASDAGGKAETIQRDVDGVLTTPPWDNNVMDAQYELVTSGGNVYTVLVSNTVKTPDGTTYVYAKKGYYTSGMKPWDDAGATAQPSNVLKVTSVTDRQGNVTTYTYGAGTVSFTKANGAVTENPLEHVAMPNGHEIDFNWTSNRITSVTDGVRTVTYGYTSTLLTSVETPEGLTTTYGYGSATISALMWDSGSTLVDDPYGGSMATNLLRSITDPRGLETQVVYMMGNATILPYTRLGAGVYAARVLVGEIEDPNGVITYFNYGNAHNPNTPSEPGLPIPGPYENFWIEGSGLNSYVTIEPGSDEVLDSCYVEGFSQSGVDFYTMRINGMVGEAALGAPFTLGWVDVGGAYQHQMYYDPKTLNLLGEDRTIYDASQFSQFATPQPEMAIELNWGVIRNSYNTYNFQGKPLSVRLVCGAEDTGGSTDRTTYYAYWGKDKYFQQKAIKDPAGRYSYTDYYDSSAAAGRKGQVYKVYDDARTTFVLNTGIIPPSGTDAGKYWKYQLEPQTDTYSASFDYDSKGRPIDVYKLQKTTTSPWTYVRAHTAYGADNDGSWGAASDVTEDYGGINRVTQTTDYDSCGRATEVEDGAGQVFETTYDLDGKMQSVTRTDTTPDVNVVSYTYGTSGVSKGMPTQVVDELSGVTQDITYCSSGGGIGKVESIQETKSGVSYTVSYTYNAAGDKTKATYATPNGTTRWGYANYISVGFFPSRSRVPETIVKLDGSSYPTAEQFNYVYDTAGEIKQAYFAMTPKSGFTPATGAPWYDDGHPADSRACAEYIYDNDGTSSVSYYWETPGDSVDGYRGVEGNGYWSRHVLATEVQGYNRAKILANSCTYETTSSNRGLKKTSSFYHGSGGSWVEDRTEEYGYEANLDYLTSANYDDGLGGATPSWTYDAAGNRTDSSVVDNLNRATTIQSLAVTNDILGNRLTVAGGYSYSWDCLSRLLTYTAGGVTSTYAYRADGMRVSKSNSSVAASYYYDGQMPMETKEVSGGTTTVTKQGLGARGIEWIERAISGGATTTGFPLYDVHGNNIACLFKASSNTYTINNQRAYDAWGGIRQGGTTGDPKGRYCANLGHVQDDESGLVYMRARYYEPGTGRFLSQDPARQGFNFTTYANNNPTNLSDANGKVFDSANDALKAIFNAFIDGRDAYSAGQAGLTATWVCRNIIKQAIAALARAAGACQVIADMHAAEAVVDAEQAAFLGESADYGLELAEAEEGISATFGTAKAVALIYMKQLETFLELL